MGFDTTETVRVALNNGAQLHIEARSLGGKQQVGKDTLFPFSDLAQSIEGIADSFAAAVKKVKPQKTTLEFGIEAGIEAGKLVALLCKGETKANLKITLEWERPAAS